MTDTPGITFGGSTPILRVQDFEASLAFYRDRLGFTLDFREGNFAQVSRGGASLMLTDGKQGTGTTWVYLGVSDTDALYMELMARGTPVRQPPVNFPWGAREMQVADPDGHVLRFGSEEVPGEPLGDWLDGDGVRWRLRDDGHWDRVG